MNKQERQWHRVGNTLYFDRVTPAVERINYVIVLGDHGKTVQLSSQAPAMEEVLRKLTDRILMWERGIAESTELHALAMEARAILEKLS